MSQREIAVCVGLKNRTYSLINNLITSMNKCDDKHLLELSVCDCNTTDVLDLYKIIRRHWLGKLKFKQSSKAFSRAFSMNRAVENSTKKYVFICDADMSLPKDFILQYNKNVEKNKVWFPVCYSLLKNEKLVISESNGWWRYNGFGMVGIYKKYYIKCGGINEKFVSWGGEDNDLYNRIPERNRVRSNCFGLYHNWHCSPNNRRTVPLEYRYRLISLDFERPKYVLAVTTYNRLNYLKNLINSWLEHRNVYAEWTLIIADDGSTDGTIEYIDNLELLVKKIIIKNKRKGIHHQVNQIIKILSDIEFDICFKSDDDLEFLRTGWDDKYFEAVKCSGFDHLVFHDERWPGGKYKGYKHKIEEEQLISRIDAYNCQGAFYTITPRVIKEVGYFDINIFGLCGYGHVDYTARCCRVGLNREDILFDLKESNDYLRNRIQDYIEAPNEMRLIENTPKLLEKKYKALYNDNRIYIPYNEVERDLNYKKNKVIYLVKNANIPETDIIYKHVLILDKKEYFIFLLNVNEKNKRYTYWIDNVPIFCVRSIGRYMFKDIDILVMTDPKTYPLGRELCSKEKCYLMHINQLKKVGRVYHEYTRLPIPKEKNYLYVV
jgi:glycosyltransferase involved in cell wall biosynthesis